MIMSASILETCGDIKHRTKGHIAQLFHWSMKNNKILSKSRIN